MTTEMYVGAAVVASKAIGFGGGISPWLGRIGVVKKLLGRRAVMVKLDHDGDNEPFMFFNRELQLVERHDKVTA